jgi:hypothetical protein
MTLMVKEAQMKQMLVNAFEEANLLATQALGGNLVSLQLLLEMVSEYNYSEGVESGRQAGYDEGVDASRDW